MNVTATCPECGHDVPATVDDAGYRKKPVEIEAEAWFREDPERVEYAPMTVWGRHAMTIVRAALARDDDRELRFLRMHAETLQTTVERAFAALPDDLDAGDDSLAAHIETALARDVPAPEPQADEPPFAVGDRVQVKSTGRTGVLREIDSRGRHLIFGDDESWITGVRADNLEPAPEPQEPPRFARGSAQEAREHMRFQNAIEQRLREHGAGYETEPWFPDVIYGAAAAALAAAGAVREGDGS